MLGGREARRVREGQVADDRAATREAAPELAPLVERAYPLMVRIASFRGARKAAVGAALADAVRAAAAAAPADAERVLFRSLIGATRRLEQAAASRADDGDATVPARQLEADGSRWEGWFKGEPPSFAALERGRTAAEARGAADTVLARLPLAQRIVVVLRDVGGWPADDVAALVPQLEPDVQRALLHRGRSRVRNALERLAAARAAKSV
jgi:DNA-directed RNA polymerase specialized sigma24 family protein